MSEYILNEGYKNNSFIFERGIGSKIYITSSSCNSSSNNITINKYDAVNGRTRGTFSGLLYSYSFTPPSNHVTNCSDNVSIKGSFDITRYEKK